MSAITKTVGEVIELLAQFDPSLPLTWEGWVIRGAEERIGCTDPAGTLAPDCTDVRYVRLRYHPPAEGPCWLMNFDGEGPYKESAHRETPRSG